MSPNLPIILVELVLVLGGTLAFGWWQLRDVKRAQAERRAAEAAARAAAPAAPHEADARTAPTEPGADPAPQPTTEPSPSEPSGPDRVKLPEGEDSPPAARPHS